MLVQAKAGPGVGGGDSVLAWPSQLLVLRAGNVDGLAREARALARRLEDADLRTIAFQQSLRMEPGGCRLAVVAETAARGARLLERAADRLGDPKCEQIRDSAGIYFTRRPMGPEGRMAFLFPGEGAQYLGMLAGVRGRFACVDAFLEECRGKIEASGDASPLMRFFEPPDELGSEGRGRDEQALRLVDHAMISVMIADWALWLLLGSLRLVPDCVAGHSMGELVALWAAGCVDADAEFLPRVRTAMRRMRLQEEAAGDDAVLLAVGAGRQPMQAMVDELGASGVMVAMDNCPHQAVLVGERAVMDRVEAELKRRGVMRERLPFRLPYHTPRFAPMLDPVREMLGGVRFQDPRMPVYSCTTARPFPDDPEAMRSLAITHWAEPARFTEMVDRLHDDGVRVFVECGPRGNLSAFVEDILRGKSFVAAPADLPRRHGLSQLHQMAGLLFAHHVELSLEGLFPERPVPRAEPARFDSSMRGQVMERYVGVMESFLALQKDVARQILMRRPAMRGGVSAKTTANHSSRNGAEREHDAGACLLLGSVAKHEPGVELVMRRSLDLREDRFAAEHTVGGREISRVDRGHVGIPVMPMTFTLEMMAQAAARLFPGKVVTAVGDVSLYRWMAFDAASPGTIELSARAVGGDGGVCNVQVVVRDLGPSEAPSARPLSVAKGTVELRDRYPAAPAAMNFDLVNERPAELSVEQTYHSLFHGPMFQGVSSNERTGDEGIESWVKVLPRDALFASSKSPRFWIDPVLFDVVMHPLAAWHLKRVDQSGRIMLPVGVKRIEVYGPPLEVGTRLKIRSRVVHADARSFSHQGEGVTQDGRVHLRLEGVRCWRFYVPFGQVNFHGPKDQYFLSTRWEAAEQALGGEQAGLKIVRLEPPVDLRRGSMLIVSAQIILTPRERAIFHTIEDEAERARWLFARGAAKDAVRHVWHATTGERLFPADIETDALDGGLFHTWMRDSAEVVYPRAAVTEHEGCAIGASLERGEIGTITVCDATKVSRDTGSDSVTAIVDGQMISLRRGTRRSL